MTIERAIEDSEGRGLVGGGKMGIAKRHLGIFMPQQILDRSQVHAAHDEMRCEGMPQIVDVEILDTRPA